MEVRENKKGRYVDLTGQRFYFLTAVEKLPTEKGKPTYWKCLCDCGNYHVASASNLKHGNVKSCGCKTTEMRLSALKAEYVPPENNVVCPICGKEFHLKPYSIKRAKVHFCSKECQNNARRIYMKGSGNHQYGLRKEKNASWKGGRRLNNLGYIEIFMPEHPFATRNKLVLEHRLIAEKYLLTDENSIEIDGKRYLRPEYIVHHKNHIRTDNSPENLEIMRKEEHSSLHSLENPMPRDPITHRFVSKKL